jgi:hypothetical protein
MESLASLDIRSFSTVRQNLDELVRAQAAFDERRLELHSNGIDLARLSGLRRDYEETMRRRRREQYEQARQQKRHQASLVAAQYDRDFQAAVAAFRRHIDSVTAGRGDPLDDVQSRAKVLRFRISAIEELKVMFPVDETRLCFVRYLPTPTSAQWAEARSFLGFATQYIKEAAKVLGIPLPYVLEPLGGASRVICRLADVKRVLVPEFGPHVAKLAPEYEAALVACARHIIEAMRGPIELPQQGQLLHCLKLFTEITRDDVEALLPAAV